MTQTNTEHWTTRRLLEWMTAHFESNLIESPRLISEMLLTHVIGGQRIDLYANVDRVATDTERETLRSCVKRTIEHEPVQYIVGNTWFYGMEFQVDSSTLIPRTCTETIVEQTLHFAKLSTTSPFRIADIGTGTGCIAITIAANLSDCEIVATDISQDALLLAEKNGEKHGVQKRITYIQGNCIEPLSSLPPFDLLCSNPPYISDPEIAALEPNVGKWEPKLALSGGSDGLSIIRPLIQSAPNCLVEGGVLLVEIATSIAGTCLELASSNPTLKDVKILRDRFGDDRFLRAKKC